MSSRTETPSMETRITLLEAQMDRLFGVDGDGGIIGKIEHDISQVKDLVFKARYVLMGCFFAVIVFQVLSGSGTVSLQTIIKALAH